MGKESGERLAFYMRVSSEEQAERMTIGTQEEFLEQYRGLYGHEVTGVYKDEAISGTVPLRERPAAGACWKTRQREPSMWSWSTKSTGSAGPC
jgi:DNA invertase Pin-like site-specific DNA recombinase